MQTPNEYRQPGKLRRTSPFAPERLKYLSPGRPHMNDADKRRAAQRFAEDGEYGNAAAMLALLS